jgi:Ni,Fe-hydrogenase III large subunit
MSRLFSVEQMAGLPILDQLMATGRPIPAHPAAPRVAVDTATWTRAAATLGEGQLTLLGLWGDRGAVHMALLEEPTRQVAVMSLDCPTGMFPSVGRFHAPAIRLERTVRDLYGLEAADAPDKRAWLDHRERYIFLPVEGEHLHQIPVGPIHAGIIEPGHFRFTAGGETIARLEARLGYVHKGVEKLMEGTALDHAAKLAGRLSGDSTVAYAIAFARAAETALALEIPARALWLRGLMAELERLANHLGDIGAICNDAAFALMHAHCGVLREEVLRASDRAFGHRMLRDCVIPGGVAAEPSEAGIAAIRATVAAIRQKFPALVALYDNTASLQDRTVGTGILKPELARRFGAGGYIGRASGRAFDARRDLAYAPYDKLTFEVPLREDGDVNARVWIRVREVEQSLNLVEQILDRLPTGPSRIAIDAAEGGEGMAIVEGFRGDILVALRLAAGGSVERCHLRDPSWFQWPLLEAAIEGNIVADFPLCNKSFNCSYSGHDL